MCGALDSKALERLMSQECMSNVVSAFLRRISRSQTWILEAYRRFGIFETHCGIRAVWDLYSKARERQSNTVIIPRQTGTLAIP